MNGENLEKSTDTAQPSTARNTAKTYLIFTLFVLSVVIIIILWKFSEWQNVLVNIIGVLVLILSCAFIWYFPKWQVSHLGKADLKPNEMFEAENEARKTLIQILGGIFVLISLVFAWENLNNTLKTSDATLKNAEANQLTDRFTRAITQLRDDKQAIRVGGIYALGQIARSYEKEHWQIIQVLTTFVKENAPWKKPESSEDIRSMLAPEDIQAVMNVLQQREWKREKEDERIKLQVTRLLKISLRDAYLYNASFYGSDLRGADLRNTVLEKAVLNWTTLWLTNLSGANLREADFSNAKFRNDTILDESDMQGANLTRAELNGVDLSKVKNLTWGQIYESEAIIDCKTKLPADLEQKKSELLGCR